MKPKKESIQEKKNRLLNEMIEFLEGKSKENNDEHFIIDSSLPKNCMIVTMENGEKLKLKTKFINNKLIITDLIIPRK